MSDKPRVASLWIFFTLLSTIGCGDSDTSSDPMTMTPQLAMTLHPNYTTNNAFSVTKFTSAQEGFAALGQALVAGVGTTSSPCPTLWAAESTYSAPGIQVLHTADGVSGIFANAWWTQGNEPSFLDNSGPWKLVARVAVSGGSCAASTGIPAWVNTMTYNANDVVKINTACYKAKWWNINDVPQSSPSSPWSTPWDSLSPCPANATPGSVDHINNLPVGGDTAPPVPDVTPIVPVEVPANPPPPGPGIRPAPENVAENLPGSGYALLRRMNTSHWDWFFPLRNGKFNAAGGTYNNAPYAADTNNSLDLFTFARFKKAVLEYNAYAQRNNYKQFLNDGSIKQQAEELAAFLSNVSRETSGSWSGAPPPWIQSGIWKGGLYWTQEVGYTTNADGSSPVINYVDGGSTWAPVAGRSYHGRGPIQLSWNYNYGAFSAWLYDNAIYSSVITSRDALLINPGLVNNDAVISMLSAIWFWMTAQGPKPAAHDVIYGAISNISRTSLEVGLPPVRNGFSAPSIASGETSDPLVMAYRLGTTINIINGGIECNGAASWHPGPPQRASYYNAYAHYINQTFNAGATLIPNTVNIWINKITSGDSAQTLSATCFNQKSYYGY